MNIDAIEDVGTGVHITFLMNCLEAMVRNPEWFDSEVLLAASDFCNSELAAIKRDLSAQNEKAAVQGSFVVKRKNNLIIPIVTAWKPEGKQIAVDSNF